MNTEFKIFKVLDFTISLPVMDLQFYENTFHRVFNDADAKLYLLQEIDKDTPIELIVKSNDDATYIVWSNLMCDIASVLRHKYGVDWHDYDYLQLIKQVES